MKTTINVNNEYLTIEIIRDGFRMAKVDFMDDDNHGELCRSLTIGEACKLSADIAHATNSTIDAETSFSRIKDLINIGSYNKEIEL